MRLSDHDIVCCILSERKPTEKRMEVEKLNCHKIYRVKFQSDLKSEFVKIIDIKDVDDLTMAFGKFVITILNIHASVSKRSPNARIKQTWYNSDI